MLCPPDLSLSTRAGVRVQAPGRLHLGFLDPAATLGRRFGSLGLVVDGFETVVELRPAEHDLDLADHPAAQAELPRARAHLDSVRRALRAQGLAVPPLQLRLQQVLPAHAGLGSGTQLALAVGRALSQLMGAPLAAADLARITGRGLRSGVGIAGFDQGGLLLDGGPARRRRPGRAAQPHRAARRLARAAGPRPAAARPERQRRKGRPGHPGPPAARGCGRDLPRGADAGAARRGRGRVHPLRRGPHPHAAAAGPALCPGPERPGLQQPGGGPADGLGQCPDPFGHRPELLGPHRFCHPAHGRGGRGGAGRRTRRRGARRRPRRCAWCGPATTAPPAAPLP